MQQKPNLHYWLAAMHLIGIGPITFRRWLSAFPSIEALFSASIEEWHQAGVMPKQVKLLKNPDWAAVERDLAWSQKPNCHLITLEDLHYPALLREIPDAPLILYVTGDKTQLIQPQIAIVGSRNPTPAGADIAKQFSVCLAKAGFVITSGMALGIDGAAHKGTLAAQGKTIAVMGTGLNHIYPPQHQSLAADIAQQGTLVSELPPDTLPKATNFPKRNRLISGLSLGVLVVEAALRSGSLITARCAVEQGREVFAIPGSIHNPLARGCHFLIRQGAKLVETAEDIVEELRSLMAVLNYPLKKDSLLMQAIGYEVTALDTIIERSGLTASEVSSMLLSLELQGYVQSIPGGYVRNPDISTIST